MSKQMNLPIYKQQIICKQPASAGVLVWRWIAEHEVQSSNPQGAGEFFR